VTKRSIAVEDRLMKRKSLDGEFSVPTTVKAKFGGNKLHLPALEKLATTFL
jgi:hypothetical protein